MNLVKLAVLATVISILSGCASVNERVLECQRQTGWDNDKCFQRVIAQDHANANALEPYAAFVNGYMVAQQNQPQAVVYAPEPIPAPVQPQVVYIQPPAPIQAPVMPQTPGTNVRFY